MSTYQSHIRRAKWDLQRHIMLVQLGFSAHSQRRIELVAQPLSRFSCCIGRPDFDIRHTTEMRYASRTHDIVPNILDLGISPCYRPLVSVLGVILSKTSNPSGRSYILLCLHDGLLGPSFVLLFSSLVV
jgi:hypothetical protein